jgi:hypothetical protein
MTPLLVLLFGVPPATAVGTDLLYAAMTKAGGTVVHGRKGHIDWAITGRLAAGSIPAAAVTLWVLALLPKGSSTIGAAHLARPRLGAAADRRRLLFGRAARLRQPGTMIRRCAARASGQDHRRRRARCSACWSPFRRSAPARWASQRCSSSTPAFHRCASSARTSPTPCR